MPSKNGKSPNAVINDEGKHVEEITELKDEEILNYTSHNLLPLLKQKNDNFCITHKDSIKNYLILYKNNLV